MSSSGLALRTTKSAHFPGSNDPSSLLPRNAAALLVAAVSTCSGVSLACTISSASQCSKYPANRAGGPLSGLEDRGGSGRSILALSRTTDGGHSWRHSSTTLVAPPGAGYTPLLDFSDASHGWLVFGGATWRTSDGGINWT